SRCENVRQTVEPRSESRTFLVRPGKILHARLALTRCQWIRPDAREVELFEGKCHRAHLNGRVRGLTIGDWRLTQLKLLPTTGLPAPHPATLPTLPPYRISIASP